MTPLERLLAEQDISRLITFFVWANDAGDWDAVAATFAEDGRLVRPSGGDAIVGRDAILASLKSRPPRKTRHLLANILVDVTGATEARARCAMTLYSSAPDEGNAASPALVGGYKDWLVRTADGWRFAERIGFLDFKVALS